MLVEVKSVLVCFLLKAQQVITSTLGSRTPTYLLFRLTRECVAIPNHVQIQKLIKVLGTDFALSQNSNMRKGGLIGLAAMAIALGKVSEKLEGALKYEFSRSCSS